MKLAFQAFDKAGRSVQDTIEAATREEATETLRRQGFFVTSVTDAETIDDDEQVASRPSFNLMRGARLKHLAMFTRQLYVLLCTGTPMVEALGALERQAKDGTWKAVVGGLRHRVEQGQSLSEAMAEYPRYFDAVYRSLIMAGEQGGKFEPILERLSQLTKKQLQTRNALIGSMVYPALLLCVSGVVLISMLVFVLPRFTTLFTTLDLPLPPSTQIMVTLSDVLRDFWWLIVPSTLLTIVATGWWLTTPPGKRAFDLALIRVPLIREVTRSFITARIIRLLGVLSDSYVPLLDALDLCKQAANHSAYRQLVENAQDAVTRGDPISVAFSDEKLISPTVYEAIRSGEATGKVSTLLLNMADFLDEENEVVLKTATSILEPLILIGLGILVGLVAVSMFLPLFDLTAQAGAG